MPRASPRSRPALPAPVPAHTAPATTPPCFRPPARRPQTRGYFSQPTPPVGSVGPSPINYWKIYCRDEYNLVVNKKYKELEVGCRWLLFAALWFPFELLLRLIIVSMVRITLPAHAPSRQRFGSAFSLTKVVMHGNNQPHICAAPRLAAPRPPS